MMDYPDFMRNWQTGYSNLYSGTASAMQPIASVLSAMMQGAPAYQAGPAYLPRHHWRHYRYERECGCCEDDCGCECCISCCADVVEYARCGEIRHIPIVFDNDSRRERDVTLQLGNFATESGLDVGWKTEVSPKEFKLAPCGHTTCVLSVEVDCSKLTRREPDQLAINVPGQRAVDVESCKVAYATLSAEGCTVCPLVIAVAVLPERCDAHHTSCL
ncbi:MAG: hypothetical protein JO076_13440, partial [Verrucomicrobia bacterium]|nr:hypothetical protein [Verrucomicrobiota bacterium]